LEKTMPKAQRISPARTATDKARKAALAEIQQRLDTPKPPTPPTFPPVANPPPRARSRPKAGSPRPPAQTSGGKGKKGTPKTKEGGKQRSATVARSAKEPKPANAAKPSKAKRLSCLDAAAQVLSASKEPMKARR
jgi:hypothetical protein